MRRIIEYCLISADGIVLDDPFPFRDYYDEPYLQDSLALFNACDAMLFGRTTYNRFAKIYGGGGGGKNPAYAARLNAIQKYVFSSKLETTEWSNSTIVSGDVAAEVAKLKQQDGGDLLILSHGLLGETLLKQCLLDVLNLGIHPVLVDHGKPFLREGQAVGLKLTATKSFSKIVKVSYEPQY
jgi:dihydrofolate reductase